ncbi:MAG: Mrp/NBP35 family ATP-binding protein [Actinobacteria bacterium]|nr:Mrp/NBP35 family ATP-binding protein [Actinomycetota bacterium]
MPDENPLLPQIRAALHGVQDPEIHRPITDLGMVDVVTVDDEGHAVVRILLTTGGCPLRDRLRNDVTAAVSVVDGVTRVTVDMGVMDSEQQAALRAMLRGGVPERDIPFAKPTNHTRVLAIASGKGGVGKSSVAVNLALALAAGGKSVGLLDADVYGHSVPDLLGLAEDEGPTALEDVNLLLPVETQGIKVISVGMMKPSRDQVIAWRGPILDRALTQLLADVYWGDLDFLVLDMPPGTGDIAISLGQRLPGAEVIVVTTPQQAATEVAERAGTMAGIMKQRVIGVVENMAYLETTCPHCGESHRVDVFGSGGGLKVSAALTERLGYDVPLLAEIPLETDFRAAGDAGTPLVAVDGTRPSAAAIVGLAQRLIASRKTLVGQQLGVIPVG